MVLGIGLWLWHAFRDPAALPAPGTAGARVLGLLGPVPYSDPALVARIRATRIVVLATFACLAALGWLERARVADAVRRFFTTRGHAIDLAVFRIVVFWQAYALTSFDSAAWVGDLPQGLQFPPATGIPAVGPLAALAHWPPHVLTASQLAVGHQVMAAASVVAMLGCFSRVSAAVVAALLFYVWGAFQWYGKVDHHHHVLWFALVLAASPCGDALSVDALLRRRSAPAEPALAYGLPLRMCMLLMGVAYFFPGFWKIWRSGFDWFLGETPFNQIYLKWHMIGDWMPAFRIDQHPWLVRAGALGTILFELSFIFLIFGRRTIWLAAAAGVVFHTSLNVLMRHGFETLRNCYLVFVPWHGLLARLRLLPPAVPRPVIRRSALPAALVGTALVLVNASAGARRLQDGWPIACYPLFDGLLPDTHTTMQIVVVRPDGTEHTVMPDDYRHVFGTRWNHVIASIVAEDGTARRRELLRLVWDVLARADPSLPRPRAIRFYAVRTWIRPERWHEPPGDPELIGEVTL